MLSVHLLDSILFVRSLNFFDAKSMAGFVNQEDEELLHSKLNMAVVCPYLDLAQSNKL